MFDPWGMPEPQNPLHAALTGPYFSSRILQEQSLPWRALHTPGVLPVSQSIWRHVGSPADSPHYLKLLQGIHPEGVFSHETAAALWGMWMPWGNMGFSPVHLSKRRTDGGPPWRQGIKGHQLPPHAKILDRVGVRVTSPAWTWVDLAGTRMSFEDLVAAGDSLLQRGNGPAGQRDPGLHPLSGVEDIKATIAVRPKVKGIVRCREAVELLRADHDSRPESLVRTRLLEAGLPEPTINPVLRMSKGKTIQPDLAWIDLKVCIQYEGDHHRADKDQWHRDIGRDRTMHQDGWVVLRLTSRDLESHQWQAFLGEVRQALGIV